VGAFCRGSWQQSRLSDDWSGTLDTLGSYWRVYGGWRALVRSPALWASVALALVSFPLWLQNTSAGYVFSIVPNLLGFSIGAMAVVLAFPTSEIFNIIAEGGREDSYYLDLVTKFVHFVIIQVLSLVLALLTAAFPFCLFSLLTLMLLYYAVITAIMTALALFDVAIFYNSSESPGD
jgi:hypothetical protein